MKRTMERAIWIGIVVVLLAGAGVVFAGPAGKMITLCQNMMEAGTASSGAMPDGGTPSQTPARR